MKRKLSFKPFFLYALLLTLSASCKKEIRVETGQEKLSSSSMTQAVNQSNKLDVGNMQKTDILKDVKRATSRFHSTTQAIKAGYIPSDHCVSHPVLGGMGYHWVNPSLIDNVFDPSKPEAILYATGPGGNLRLVAVEYIVLNTGQQAPMFGNQLFDVNGTPDPQPHWSLHVWLYEDNPSGMFAPFNPNISCP